MSTLPEPDDYDRVRDEIRDGIRAHPSHPAWWRPPIPWPPTVCEACGCHRDDETAYQPCDPQEPSDEQLEALYGAPSATERHAVAWQEHKETHR